MRFRPALLFVLCLVLLGGMLPPTVQQRINAIVNDPASQPALWSVYVADARTGEVVYTHDAGMTMLPASTMKLFTAATALDALGADYRYTTDLRFKGVREGGVLDGDLVLRGSGDPSFGSSLVTGPDPLRTWALAHPTEFGLRLEFVKAACRARSVQGRTMQARLVGGVGRQY